MQKNLGILSKIRALFYDKTEIDTKLSGKSNTNHSHNDVYYTETEIDTKLAGYVSTTNHANDLGNKANLNHSHTISQVTNLESRLSGIESDITTLQAGGGFEMVIVASKSALPATGARNTIYLVGSTGNKENNFIEYAWDYTNNKYEEIGREITIDTSSFITALDLEDLIDFGYDSSVDDFVLSINE